MKMAVINIGGVISVAFFYGLILAVGIYVGWKQKKKVKDSENIMLAGRDLRLFVGILTMCGKFCYIIHYSQSVILWFFHSATWVAGGFINATCEGTFTGGFIAGSTLAIGYSLSLFIGCFTRYSDLDTF